MTPDGAGDAVPEITVEALLDRYDALLLDAYGVLVHEHGALPGAAELIAALDASRKPYYVVTNDASKLPATAARRYAGHGLPIPAERIITSGLLLSPYFAAHGLVGGRCVVLGPDDSRRYVEQAGGVVVPPTVAFDALVVADEAGFPFRETVNRTLSGLCREVDHGRRIHLVLPNPDLVYPDGNGFGLASGSIALMLEAALCLRYPTRPRLVFTRLGKPHAAMFVEAVRRAGSRNVVMLGDQLETDIRGARAAGLDAALVGTGVTAGDATGPASALGPTYRLRSLALRAPAGVSRPAAA